MQKPTIDSYLRLRKMAERFRHRNRPGRHLIVGPEELSHITKVFKKNLGARGINPKHVDLIFTLGDELEKQAVNSKHAIPSDVHIKIITMDPREFMSLKNSLWAEVELLHNLVDHYGIETSKDAQKSHSHSRWMAPYAGPLLKLAREMALVKFELAHTKLR